MDRQVYNWTCSVASFVWVLGATDTAHISRQEALNILGYPDCVNETYGAMGSQCLIDGFATFGLKCKSNWVTYEAAYATCESNTGMINPQGMYHFMGIRGVQGNNIWLANSAPGYKGVWDILSRPQFNSLGPVELFIVS